MKDLLPMKQTPRTKKTAQAARGWAEQEAALSLARHRYHLAYLSREPRTDTAGPPAAYFEHAMVKEAKPTRAWCVRCERPVWAHAFPGCFKAGCNCTSVYGRGVLLRDEFTTAHWTKAIAADQPLSSHDWDLHRLPLKRAGTVYGGTVNGGYWLRLEREKADADLRRDFGIVLLEASATIRVTGSACLTRNEADHASTPKRPTSLKI